MADFSPINQVTPFTQRDNASYLKILRDIQVKVNETIEAFNDLNIENVADHNKIVKTLTDQFNNALQSVSDELTELIQSTANAGVATDPTSGQVSGVQTVLNNVFDNSRVFAYFAKEYDGLELTAAQYDNQAMTARHYDLGVTYPRLNDTPQ